MILSDLEIVRARHFLSNSLLNPDGEALLTDNTIIGLASGRQIPLIKKNVSENVREDIIANTNGKILPKKSKLQPRSKEFIDETRDSLHQFLGNGIGDVELGKKLLNLSVLLNGTPKIDHAQIFNGSGAIFACEDPYTIIVTAKHNLHIFMNQFSPPMEDDSVIWDEDFVSQFISEVSICYGQRGNGEMSFGAIPARKAKISALIPVFPERVEELNTIYPRVNQLEDNHPFWEYDVMLVISEDEALHEYASAQVIPFDDKKKKQIVRGLNATKEQNSMLNPSQFNQFIQVGYGEKTAKAKTQSGMIDIPLDSYSAAYGMGKLQYRLVTPKHWASYEVYDAEEDDEHELTGRYWVHSEVILCHADFSSSSNKGDSGGPLFAISTNPSNPNQVVAYIIGVTLGADFTVDNPNTKVPDYSNNGISSLRYLYQYGLPELNQ